MTCVCVLRSLRPFADLQGLLAFHNPDTWSLGWIRGLFPCLLLLSFDTVFIYNHCQLELYQSGNITRTCLSYHSLCRMVTTVAMFCVQEVIRTF